jgi:serine/threonine-protein kinase
MELVDGPTLADRLAQEPIPLDDALPIAKQIADALEAAHEQGIIHRDLKPANIKVKADGMVKVLDFGLARASQASDSGLQTPGLTQSPTITTPAMTQVGVLLGTAAYMSPEQAKGKPVDKRSDIWAFGCVLFEMLSGVRAFRGEDVAETLASVINGSIDWTVMPAMLPPVVRQLIEGCLQRDRKLRIADISTARYVLASSAAAKGHVSGPRDVAKSHRWAIVAASLLAGAAISGFVVSGVASGPRVRPPEIMRFTVTTNAQPISIHNLDRTLAIAPDGKYVAYISGYAPSHLLIRSLDKVEPVRVPDSLAARAPFFSPDGAWVGYYDNVARELRKVSVTGGQSFVMSRSASPPRGAAWASDGSIVFGVNAQNVGLQRLPSGGGASQALTKPDRSKGELNHAFPSVLPSGDILFTIWTGSIETSQVAVLEAKSGQQKMLLRGGTHAEYVPTGHLIYASASALYAVRFDAERLEILGAPVPVVERVFVAGSGAGAFSVSATGTLIYLPNTGVSDEIRSLVWVDREGREESIPTSPHRFAQPRFSPDGGRVALDTRDPDNNDIWIWNFGRRTLTRVTTDLAPDWQPVWTPDGTRLVYAAARDGVPSPFWQTVDPPGRAEKLYTASSAAYPLSFSPDGRVLVFSEGGDLKSLTLTTSESVHAPLFQTASIEANADLSRDGRWLAYQSNESGRNEIYVRPFPDVSSRMVQISSNGGTQPVWSRDGKELFFVDPSPALMSTAIETRPNFAALPPTRLLDMSPYYLSTGQGRPYDVSLDGRRFLMIKDATDATKRPSAIAVLNWIEELKRLLPMN